MTTVLSVRLNEEERALAEAALALAHASLSDLIRRKANRSISSSLSRIQRHTVSVCRMGRHSDAVTGSDCLPGAEKLRLRRTGDRTDADRTQIQPEGATSFSCCRAASIGGCQGSRRMIQPSSIGVMPLGTLSSVPM